jgi:hypothetical protein
VGGFRYHLFSYSVGTIGSFPEVGSGGTGRGADYLPQVMLRLRMSGVILKLPLTPCDLYRYNCFCTGKRIVGGPSHRRLGLSPGLGCVGCVEDKVALGQVLPLSVLFCQCSILMYLSPTNVAIFIVFLKVKT